MLSRPTFLAIVLCLSLSGCGASLPNLSTGSLFGGSSAPPAPVAPVNQPTSRAVQVGTTSARALKCGFNFDPVKLRTQYLASEAATATNPADTTKLGQIYDIAFRGVSKDFADQGDGYCSSQKTDRIKLALNRHLAGDYAPEPPAPVEEEDGGLFGNVGASDGGTFKDSNPMNRNE